jgi:ectoine hydroxylase-related dioxygenase (phytanoyl-CoA dioxygenase family)
MPERVGRGVVTADDVERFAASGALVIRGLFEPGEVETLRTFIDVVVAAPSPRGIVASPPGQPAFFEDFCNWQDHVEMIDLLRNSAAADVAAALMESTTVRFFHDHVLVKEPGAQQRTPWHQDQPYYNVAGRQNVSMWIPVDPVERADTLEFVAGSHRGTWYLPTTFLTEEARWFPEGSLEPVPDVDARRGELEVLGWALEPGDAVCFHMLSLHAAAGNSATRSRRVVSLRFLGDDARHAPRHWVTSPDFPGLADELADGAPMDHPLFPLLRGGA